MNEFSPQWRTLNTSWPEEGTMVDIVYEPVGDDKVIVINVSFIVDRYGNATFKKNEQEYFIPSITGWRYTMER